MGPITLQEGIDGFWDLRKSRGRGLISLCLAVPWALMKVSHAEDDPAIHMHMDMVGRGVWSKFAGDSVYLMLSL